MAAAGIVALLRAQDPARFVTLKELSVRRRTPGERTAQQQESGTEQSSTRPCLQTHKRNLPCEVNVVWCCGPVLSRSLEISTAHGECGLCAHDAGLQAAQSLRERAQSGQAQRVSAVVAEAERSPRQRMTVR